MLNDKSFAEWASNWVPQERRERFAAAVLDELRQRHDAETARADQLLDQLGTCLALMRPLEHWAGPVHGHTGEKIDETVAKIVRAVCAKIGIPADFSARSAVAAREVYVPPPAADEKDADCG